MIQGCNNPWKTEGGGGGGGEGDTTEHRIVVMLPREILKIGLSENVFTGF